MCNLYSMTRNQDAIRRLFKVGRDQTGILAGMSGIFPDNPARQWCARPPAIRSKSARF